MVIGPQGFHFPINRRGGLWRLGYIEKTLEGCEADLELLGRLPEREASLSDSLYYRCNEALARSGWGLSIRPPSLNDDAYHQ